MPQRGCLLRCTVAHDCSGFHLMYKSLKVTFLPWLLVAKHSSINSWWQKHKKLWGKKTAANTISCLTIETYYYFYYYSIFCWDFLCNNIASFHVTTITCSCAWKTQGHISLCSPTLFFFHSGDIQELRDAQADPRLLNINAARFQVHLDVGDRLICSRFPD